MGFKKLLILGVLFYWSRFNFAYNGRQLVEELGASLCPFTNFCYKNATKVIQDKSLEPCCRPCFCDDDCCELDNCCPDKEGITLSYEVLPCKDTEVKVKEGQGIVSDSDKWYFRVVDKCPSSEENITLRSKCRGVNRTKIEDYVWVSNKTNGRIFQNIHCAKCHGLSDFVPWQIKTACSDILTSENMLETLLSDRCNIINVMPEENKENRHMSNKYECFDPRFTYTKCDQSVQAGNFTQEVVTACARSSWPLVTIISGRPTIDKNAFCRLCNVGRNIETGDYCIVHEDDPKHGGLGTFSAVMDFRDSTLYDQPAESSTCRINEVEDKYLRHCHKLICPMGKAAMYGRCEKLLTSLVSTCVDVLLYFRVLREGTSLQVEGFPLPGYGEEMYIQIIHQLGFGKDNCAVDSSDLRMTRSRLSKADYILWLSILPSPACPLYFIAQIVHHTVNRILTVTVNTTGQFHLLPRLDGQTDFFEIGNELNQIFVNSSTLPCLPVRLETDRICPTINLKWADLKLFSANQVKEKSLFISFFDQAEIRNETAVVPVCFDDYFAVMSVANFSHCVKANIVILLASFYALSDFR